jgi:hypothetical protein
MTGIEILQGVSGGLYLIVISVVGVRLLLLARRTRELPELLLGTSLLLGGSIGSSIEAVGLSGATEYGAVTVGRLFALGKLFGLVGFACEAFFIRRVFRPGDRWAGVLMLALLATLAGAFLGFAWAGSFGGAGIHHGFFYLELAARVAFPMWLFVEATRYAGLMEKRLRLGLADPVVANRFVLWSMIGALSVVLLLTSVPPLFLDPVGDRLLLVADMLVFSVTGVALSLVSWLAFFPPAGYRRRIETRAAERSAAGELA